MNDHFSKITNNKKCEICFDTSLKQALLSKRDWWFPVKDKAWEQIKMWKQDLILTKLDLVDFSDISDKDLAQIIEYHLSIKIWTKDWIEKFNEHFQIALWIYSNTRARWVIEKRWGIKFDEISKFYPFSDKKDIFNFLRLAEKKDWLWRISCFVSKLTYAVIDILDTPWLSNLEKEEEKIFKDLQVPLQIEQESSYEWNYIWNIWWKDFVLYWRPKSLRSAVEKIIWNPDYATAESIKDWIWYTFEIDWWDRDVLILMQHLYNVVKSLKWKIDSYDNKWVKIDEKIVNLKLDKEFVDFLLEHNWKWWKKLSSSHWYKEIKLQGNLNWIRFEIKFTNKWNWNQDWLSLQSIYEYLDKYIKWIVIRNWWRWYITDSEISDLVKDFFERLNINLSNNPEKRWSSRKDYEKELWDDLQKNWFIAWNLKYENAIIWKNPKIYNHLMPGLRKYYESKLIKAKLDDWSIVYTSVRWFELSKVWIYPNMCRRVDEKNVKEKRRHNDKNKKVLTNKINWI